jgi:hypothetical protein
MPPQVEVVERTKEVVWAPLDPKTVKMFSGLKMGGAKPEKR